MSDYSTKNVPELRKLAGAKAKADGFPTTEILTRWKKPQLVAYLSLPAGVSPYQVQASVIESTPPISTDAEVLHPLDLADVTTLADDAPEVLPKPASLATAGLKMEFSTFARKTDNKAKPLILDKQSFIDLLSKHHVRQQKDGKLFAPATFTGTRTKDNFISASGICLDFDHEQPSIEQVLNLIPGTLAAYYSTFAHCWKNKEHKEDGVIIPEDRTYAPEKPRFRVVIPLSRPVNADEHVRLVSGIRSIIPPDLMECLDSSCFECSRPHYLPSCPPEHECHAFTGHQDGEPLDVDYFLNMGDTVVVPATKHSKPSTAAPIPPAALPIAYEFADPATGEVFPLTAWAAKNPAFDIVAAIDQQHFRGEPKGDGKQHITCPFEDQHTDQGQDLATFIANASPPQYNTWDVHCCHAHCTGRDRLDHVQAMLEKGWLSVDQFQAAAPAPSPQKLNRPPYFNYRGQEIAAELVKQPLSPEEFQFNLHLMHVAVTAYNGTLPDDSWTISRILGITEDRWIKEVRPTFVRSGWQVVEGDRIFNPITLREYHVSQDELARKISGGKKGGLRTQQKKKDREAYLEG